MEIFDFEKPDSEKDYPVSKKEHDKSEKLFVIFTKLPEIIFIINIIAVFIAGIVVPIIQNNGWYLLLIWVCGFIESVIEYFLLKLICSFFVLVVSYLKKNNETIKELKEEIAKLKKDNNE